MGAGGKQRAERGQAFGGALGPATRRILPAGGATHLHLLRHGEVERLAERVLWGQEDVLPSATGARQGVELARWFAAQEPTPTRVVSSDLRRCRDLAEFVARDAGLELELEPRLREQHLGAWQGRTWEAISASEPDAVRSYWADYVHARPPGGESFGDLGERVRAWWATLDATTRGGRLVLVTHVGVIRVLLAHFLGLPLDQALRLAPAVGSHTALALSEAGAVLEAFGERPWTFAGARAEERP